MTTPVNRARPAAPMTPERWRAIDAVLQAALACAPVQRAAFVADACGSDIAMRHEVESLLAAHEESGDFLERPALPDAGVLAPMAPVSSRLAVAVDGRYVVEGELARGGMATVHLARDPRHGRRVAIKVLRDELSAALGAERFLKEIEVTASLQHPHILPLFDSGSAGGLLYYVMPLVEGETLRARLARDRRLPVDEAVRLASEMAGALEHAHRRGVVHRDVKPENVLLQGERGSTHAVVADFGIALAIQQAGGERLTRTGLTLGTPQYMAPEQARGDKDVDARADVYALGAVLFEMIAGEPPFAAPTAQQVVARVMHDAPPSLAQMDRRVPPHLDAAVRRALAKRPEERFPSAAAFATAIATPAPAAPAPATPWDTDEPPGRPRTVTLGTAAKLAAAMLLGGVGAGWWLATWQASGASAAPWQPAAPVATAPAVNDIVTTDIKWGEGDLGLALVDRAGRTQGAIVANRPWTPRFSPDGRRVVYGAFGEGRETSDLWIADLESRTARRLTDDEGDANDAQWGPDGRTIAYSASAAGGKDVFVYSLDGRTSKPLARRAGNQFPSDWSRDGRTLLVTDDAMGGGRNVVVQPVGGGEAWPLAATGANEASARLSPDGRWVAYTADEDGRSAVWVQSYPTPGRRVKVSAGDGGRDPAWKGDGSEVYYWQGDQLIAARVGRGGADGTFVVEARTPLFRARYHESINSMYDASPDGQRFVIVVEK